MADITQVMPNSSSVKAETPNSVEVTPSLEGVIEEFIGGFGWAQLVQAILVSLSSFFDAQQTFMSVYSDAEPKWHCVKTSACKSSSKICEISKQPWTWNRPSSQTIISEWSLECASSFIKGLPGSSYFIGCIVGGFILATLADSSLGRKNLLTLSCLTMSLSGFITAFSKNVWIYSALRFLSGVGRASIGTCALVILTEKVGKRWRAQVGMMQFFLFTIGFLSLPGLAYINRDSSWRYLYLYTSIPAVFFCALLHFFIYESPRWLFMQGRGEEAIQILKRLAPARKLISEKMTCIPTFPSTQDTLKLKVYSSMVDLFTKKWALRRILFVMVVGFGIGMVYFGMPLGVGNLGFDIYLSVILNALLEIPSYLLTFIFLAKMNRKISLLGLCSLSGVCGIACILVRNDHKMLQIGLELGSFFFVRTAYNIFLLYTVELFPTCVRNSATSMARQALHCGAAIAPVLVSAGRNNKFLSYGVFGLTVLCCGIFVAFLPETRGANLCDTMDEQEGNDKTPV